MSITISEQELNSTDWIRRRIERLEGRRQAALREAARIGEEIDELSVDFVVAACVAGSDSIHPVFRRSAAI